MLGVSVSLLPSCSVYRRLIELMFYSGPHALSLLIHLHPTTDVHFSLAAAFFSLFAKHVGDVWHVPQSLDEYATQSRSFFAFAAALTVVVVVAIAAASTVVVVVGFGVVVVGLGFVVGFSVVEDFAPSPPVSAGPHDLSLLIHLHPTTDLHFSLAAAFFRLFAKHVGDVWHVPQSLLENCTQSRPVEVVVRRPMALTEATRPSARTIKSCMVAAFCVCFLSERRQGGEKRGEGKNWREDWGEGGLVREG